MSDSFDGSNVLAEKIRNAVIGTFTGATVGAAVATYTPGVVPPSPAGGRGYLVFGTVPPGPLVLPADYPLVYDNQSAAMTLVAGGADGQGVVAFGGLTYADAGGSAAIYTGTGAVGDTIYLNSRLPSYVAAGEGHDTVVAAVGNDVIALGGGANLAFLASGNDVLASEGSDTVVMGSGAATMSLSGRAVVYGGVGQMLLQFGAGFGQVSQGTGAVTLFGGAGGGVFVGGTDGGNVMVAGAGATTLVGGGGGDVLFASGAANDILFASRANTTLSGVGATGNDTYVAGGGADYMVGGNGADMFYSGRGNDTMAAGNGPDGFVFTAGQVGGVDVIQNFKVGIDRVYLAGYDSGDGSAAQAALAQAAANSVGGSTYVTLSDHTTIEFAGTPKLAANSFIG